MMQFRIGIFWFFSGADMGVQAFFLVYGAQGGLGVRSELENAEVWLGR